jgi:hypothetical protein
MAITAGAAADILMERVRAEGGVAFDKDAVVVLLSYCQKMLNYSFGILKTTTIKTIVAGTLLYEYGALLAYTRILRITENDRLLFEAKSPQELESYARSYSAAAVAAATRFEVWCQLGYNYICFFPILTSDVDVAITYVTDTATLTSYTTHYNTALELPDDDIELVIGLAELVLLIQARLYETAKFKGEILVKRYMQRKTVVGYAD